MHLNKIGKAVSEHVKSALFLIVDFTVLFFYCLETFAWSQTVRDTLQDVFKLKKFRPQQLQTINCIMAKKDVLMIAPTGRWQYSFVFSVIFV